jgi:hypothetical protein
MYCRGFSDPSDARSACAAGPTPFAIASKPEPPSGHDSNSVRVSSNRLLRRRLLRWCPPGVVIIRSHRAAPLCWSVGSKGIRWEEKFRGKSRSRETRIRVVVGSEIGRKVVLIYVRIRSRFKKCERERKLHKRRPCGSNAKC